MKGGVAVLPLAGNGKPRSLARGITENRPVPIDEPHLGIGFQERRQNRVHAPAIGAVIVVELNDTDILPGVRDLGSGRILDDRLAREIRTLLRVGRCCASDDDSGSTKANAANAARAMRVRRFKRVFPA